ncbi:alpha-N-methyltransferase NTM1 [Suillus subalutaceus]|uniref:alpha-N-methyltransferase NTM1 n=1 Tax=Suillus subalutaceus TaxID=48586 RepID=UPI001B85D75B|nr:alpha-N-methyltransferase NTM1 [Suillus subalutaceus]KAG1878040.1 alpha-N-methyltransferase NTM1 [Suillus subalutaceus]
MSSTDPVPDLEAGIQYWATQPANYDGVLGGFGTGSLPRVDSLGSRRFLLDLLPELSTVPSPFRSLSAPPSETRRVRALDVGAGVGRVTSDVLLPLVSDVVLLEPVEPFINEARSRGKASESGLEINDSGYRVLWKGIADRSKSGQPLDRVGYLPQDGDDDMESKFDVIWCQWCLGHLKDDDLVQFLQRSRKALRDARSLIVVKENICREQSEPVTVFDEQDSSFTRSDLAFKNVFRDAGLKIIQEKIQHGLPEGLFPVKMYALREA